MASAPPVRDATTPIVLPAAESARQTITRGQSTVMLAVVAVLAFALLLEPMRTLEGVAALVTALYLINATYRAWLVKEALAETRTLPTPDEALAALRDEDLPVYTVLVPVYREAGVVAELIGAMARLDYPMQLLDVQILLEEDDSETIAAVNSLLLPPHIRPTIVPRGYPRGKPRACNYGLQRAKGDYCVIFDAEDAPEPAQLKKAVLAFQQGGDDLACVQAKLNYYNAEQNLLTRLFTVEYSTLFDLILPGLTALHAPVPLGGTSNHFPTALLLQLGAWDSFNVTEDADLGMRLARRGYRTALIDSTTYEEANCELGNWIRQRSRWIKGYLQTWLVHMRAPRQLARELGPAGFLGFQVMICGTVFFALINPLFWALLVVWYVTRATAIQTLYQGPVIYFAALCFFAGNPVAVYTAMAGCVIRRKYALLKYCLLMPFYWMLMSVAAWKAAIQLIYKPHYWEKTRHGLARSAVVVAATPAPTPTPTADD